MGLCSRRCAIIFILITAIPVSYIISQEKAEAPTHVYHYHSSGFFRECAKWDKANHRFLISRLEGGLAEIKVPKKDKKESAAAVLEEHTVINDADVSGNASLGFVIDSNRNRVVVVHADMIGNKFSAVAAYSLSTWDRLFLATLTAFGDGKAFADDVAVDAEGNAYVTDTRNSKIWKVGVNGEIKKIITSPLFTPKEWYKNFVGLNGIAYHPDGYLLVIHTFSGNLLKVDVANGDEVKLVNVVGGSLVFGDGLELISPTKLVIAGNPSGRLVESSDGWETASVVGVFKGPKHRLATGATVKDGKVYLNHLIGMGFPKKTHALVEAVFSS